MLIRRSEVWTRQPPTRTPADPANPITRDAYVWLPSAPLLLAGKRTLTAIGETAYNSSPVGSVGVARKWSRSANAGIDFGATQAITQNAGVTVLVVAAPTAAASMKVPFSQRIGSGNYTQTDFTFNAASIDSLGATAGQLALTTYHAGSGGVLAAGQVDGRTHCWVAGNGPGNGYIFRDGIKQALSTSTRMSTFAAGVQKMRIGNIADDTTTTYPCDDPVFLIIVWDRLLSEAEAQVASAYPWQLLLPERRTLFIPASVGGTTQVTSDTVASYLIRNAISQDLASLFGIRGAAQSNLSAAYNLRESAANDAAMAYAIRAAVIADRTAGYNLREGAFKDATAAYSIRGAVISDRSGAYDILSANSVSASFDAGYAVRGTVQADRTSSFAIRAAVGSNGLADYAIRAAVQSSLPAGYGIEAGVSAVSSDLPASYHVDGAAAQFPSAAEIAAAILVAAQAAPIHADVRRIKGLPIFGNGQAGDEFHV